MTEDDLLRKLFDNPERLTGDGVKAAALATWQLNKESRPLDDSKSVSQPLRDSIGGLFESCRGRPP